jgi:hypothetical protein
VKVEKEENSKRKELTMKNNRNKNITNRRVHKERSKKRQKIKIIKMITLRLMSRSKNYC